ncbi:hypothetical protein KR200_004884, partial [Drosophila serrata]
TFFCQFEEVKIPVPWGHISGRWYGNRKERPILALHGWLDNLGTFDRLIPLLPDYIGVLCIDFPGHGRSSHIQHGLFYSDYVTVIPIVMKEYGWTKVSLMGHSMGGFQCFMYASINPQAVDMIITLDILLPLKNKIENMAMKFEKQLVEIERQNDGNYREPPSYTFAQLEQTMTKRRFKSEFPELAKHLLHRQLSRSKLYPERFYYSRDARIMNYHYLDIDDGLAMEMARQVKGKPFLIIKGSRSPYLSQRSFEAIGIMAEDNPHFELYEVEGGTHYVHLHAAEECARYIVPFIRHHRPPALTSWSLAGKEAEVSLTERHREPKEYPTRSSNNRSKL